MALTFREIADILKAIDESRADEISIEVEGLRLSVSKRGASASPQTNPDAPTREIPTPAKAESESVPVQAPSQSVHEKTQAPSGHEILRAPMVGTFYRRPSPDEQPFVEIGSKVSKGDPVCLIEVMKLYTTIESTVNGEIVSIFADDGVLVDFDQQLFLIKTQDQD